MPFFAGRVKESKDDDPINAKNPNTGMTALHWAAFNDDQESVKLLLKFGAVSTFNKKMLSPCDIAARCLHYESVEVFIEEL